MKDLERADSSSDTNPTTDNTGAAHMNTRGYCITGILALTLMGRSPAASQTFTPHSQPAQKNQATLVDTAAHPAPAYRCPMDHEVVSDKPGTCPKCGMKLEKMASGSAAKASIMSATSAAAVSSREKCPGMAKTAGTHHEGMAGGMMPHDCCAGKDKASCEGKRAATGKGKASCPGKDKAAGTCNASCSGASTSAGSLKDSVSTQ